MRRFGLQIFLALSLVATAIPARAAEDPYVVKGIPVDATAASAIEAQTIAINSGRAKAWAALYRRLTKAQDWPRQPALDDVTLQRMIRNYLPADERRSTTRYVASMTYAFNPDAVRRILRQNDIAYADMQAHPILVIPMAPGYEPRGAWASAWANPRYSAGSVPLILPRGDALDASALAPLNFSTMTWQDVEPAASRVHAQEAFVALAQPGNRQFIVKLKRLSSGNSPPIADVVAAVPPMSFDRPISPALGTPLKSGLVSGSVCSGVSRPALASHEKERTSPVSSITA